MGKKNIMVSCTAFFGFLRFESRKAAGAAIMVAVLFGIMGQVCAAEEVVSGRSIMLEEPRVLNGIIVREDGSMGSADLLSVLDSIDRNLSKASADGGLEVTRIVAQADNTPAQPAAPATPPDPNKAAPASAPAPPAPAPAPAPAPPAPKPEPKPASLTTLISLPKLSDTEFREISEQLAMSLGSELGYMDASDNVSASLPAAPMGLVGLRTLARPETKGTYVLRFGYRLFISQPSQLWVMGVIVETGGQLAVNPDMAGLEKQVTDLIASLNKMREGLTVRDLEVKVIQLSYVDATRAQAMLANLGVTTLDKAPDKIDFAALPYVVKIPDPGKEYTGLIGGTSEVGSGKLSLSPGIASAMADNTVASPLTQLLVMFHPARPEQFSEVRRLLDLYVDCPARQIFIEAMVLEISETGLNELGVKWDLKNNSFVTIPTVGATSTGGASTVDVTVTDVAKLNQFFDGGYAADWGVKILALIREGKAQVLSRPSVLTLNNRQSTIRVGQDIPIASSLQGSNSYNVSFKFEYLPIGILLNIRPRINESGSEVSMLVDTIVSAEVPGGDLEMKGTDSTTILASAPTVSTRRVQTYGRIANNTPLIIGGLVAEDKVQTTDKVPLLGDLPWVGLAFRAEKIESLKREVIIVLTPHVLPEEREVRRSYPKDEDSFDSFGHELFRDSYRIRSEDVFDLTFLLENQRIVVYRRLAREVAQKNFRLGETEPFRWFVKDSVPGESILVTRMIYEVIKRLDIAEKIDPTKIIYFKSQQELGGYDVQFLNDLLKGEKEGTMKDFGDKALAITYVFDRESLEKGRLGSEPIPDIQLVDCPNKEAWGTKLWELNQPMPDGRQRHTILIKSESDLTRLRRALALKKIALLAGGTEHMRLRNFSVGKVLPMPELKDGQIHVIDADTAMFFFHTEHYYAATLAEIEKQLNELDTLLRRPDISILLDSPLREIEEGDAKK